MPINKKRKTRKIKKNKKNNKTRRYRKKIIGGDDNTAVAEGSSGCVVIPAFICGADKWVSKIGIYSVLKEEKETHDAFYNQIKDDNIKKYFIQAGELCEIGNNQLKDIEGFVTHCRLMSEKVKKIIEQNKPIGNLNIEKVDGKDLFDVLGYFEDNELNEHTINDIDIFFSHTTQLFDAVEYVNDKLGFQHLDIRIPNIMWERNNKLFKIIDYGLVDNKDNFFNDKHDEHGSFIKKFINGGINQVINLESRSRVDFEYPIDIIYMTYYHCKNSKACNINNLNYMKNKIKLYIKKHIDEMKYFISELALDNDAKESVTNKYMASKDIEIKDVEEYKNELFEKFDVYCLGYVLLKSIYHASHRRKVHTDILLFIFDLLSIDARKRLPINKASKIWRKLLELHELHENIIYLPKTSKKRTLQEINTNNSNSNSNSNSNIYSNINSNSNSNSNTFIPTHTHTSKKIKTSEPGPGPGLMIQITGDMRK